MSRAPGGFGRMGGKDLPFEVDAALEDHILSARQGQDDDDDWQKTLYPEMRMYHAPPPTDREKRLVSKFREMRTARRNGPFFMDAVVTGKRDAAEFNAFEDVSTYSNKKAKRATGLPNLKKVPIVKEVLPEELWSTFTDEQDGADGQGTKKNLGFLKKRRIDKLAQFDEGGDVDAAAADDDDDEINENEDDGDDGIGEPQDDDFSEDDDDAGNDYNAEKYFDDGEEDNDDGGGGDDEDACAQFQHERMDAGDARQQVLQRKSADDPNAYHSSAPLPNPHSERQILADAADSITHKLSKETRAKKSQKPRPVGDSDSLSSDEGRSGDGSNSE